MFFKGLRAETRIVIAYVLRKKGPTNVGNICSEIGKEGKYVLYALNGEIISKIIDLTDEHVSGLFESILACEVVKEE